MIVVFIIVVIAYVVIQSGVIGAKPVVPETGQSEIPIIEDEVEFYNKIASHYDERNTNSLLETHRSIISRVTGYIGKRDVIDVLDLGGGTGRAIATQFFGEPRLRWTYLDNAPNMLQEFRKNLAGTSLQTEAILGDLHDLSVIDGRQFDIVILSLVLTTLKELPDFEAIASLIRPGGQLIIADIDPVYSEGNPIYSVSLDAGETVGLKVKSRHPLDVLQWVTKAGLKVVEAESIMKQDGIRYSYIVTSEKMLPDPPVGSDELLVKIRTGVEFESNDAKNIANQMRAITGVKAVTIFPGDSNNLLIQVRVENKASVINNLTNIIKSEPGLEIDLIMNT